VLESLKKVKYGAVTIENHTVVGGLGSSVAEVIAENGLGLRLMKLGLQDVYAHCGSQKYLLKMYGMDAMALVRGIEKLTGNEFGIDEAVLNDVKLSLKG
jgi:transketolase